MSILLAEMLGNFESMKCGAFKLQIFFVGQFEALEKSWKTSYFVQLAPQKVPYVIVSGAVDL